jgi:hypothetical protein
MRRFRIQLHPAGCADGVPDDAPHLLRVRAGDDRPGAARGNGPPGLLRAECRGRADAAGQCRGSLQRNWRDLGWRECFGTFALPASREGWSQNTCLPFQ